MPRKLPCPKKFLVTCLFYQFNGVFFQEFLLCDHVLKSNHHQSSLGKDRRKLSKYFLEIYLFSNIMMFFERTFCKNIYFFFFHLLYLFLDNLNLYPYHPVLQSARAPNQSEC